ncbi:hypothetical protein GCM10010533_01450 [Mycolicibacterium pallens]
MCDACAGGQSCADPQAERTGAKPGVGLCASPAAVPAAVGPGYIPGATFRSIHRSALPPREFTALLNGRRKSRILPKRRSKSLCCVQGLDKTSGSVNGVDVPQR